MVSGVFLADDPEKDGQQQVNGLALPVGAQNSLYEGVEVDMGLPAERLEADEAVGEGRHAG